MDINNYSRKDIGNLGEKIAAEYLRRRGLLIVAMNVSRKTGELDVIARKGNTLHVVEVKTAKCAEFPKNNKETGGFDPTTNLYANKIRKVRKTAEWYVADNKWEGEWQIDGAIVWIRKRDGMAFVRYHPQIL